MKHSFLRTASAVGFVSIALAAISSAAVSRVSLGVVAESAGPTTTPDVVNFGALSGDTTFEFSFIATKAGPSTAVAGSAAVGLKLEQYADTNTIGATIFGVSDNVFTAVDGMSVDSIFGTDVHMTFVNDTAATESRLYIDGALAGIWAGNFDLAGDVRLMGASPTGEVPTDPFGEGSTMYGWATYDSALSGEDIAELAVTPFIPEPSTVLLLAMSPLLILRRRRRA